MPSSLNICAFSRTTVWHGMSGGMDIHGAALARGLVALGHRVTLLSTRHPDGKTSERLEGIDLHFLEGTEFGARRAGWSRASVQRFLRLHRERPVDIVWSQSFDAFGLAWHKRVVPALPIVATLHGSVAQEARTFAVNWRAGGLSRVAASRNLVGLVYSYAAVQWPLLRASSRLIAVSEQVRRDLRRLFGPSVAGKCTVIPNGVDTKSFAPDPLARPRLRQEFGIPDNCTVLLSLGRLTPEKGHHIAIDALARLPRGASPVKLLIVGQGPYLTTLQERARCQGVGEDVLFPGSVPHHLTSAYYNCADLFVMPTLTVEGLPFVILEAMACGTPVIASRMGGNSEVVGHGRTGLLAEPGDATGLAVQIRSLLNNRPALLQISDAALRLVRSRYSLDQMLQATCATIEAEAHRNPSQG